jgi:hypothetical protein
MAHKLQEACPQGVQIAMPKQLVCDRPAKTKCEHVDWVLWQPTTSSHAPASTVAWDTCVCVSVCLCVCVSVCVCLCVCVCVCVCV